MIIASTSNHNFMCFDESDGSPIKVLSQHIFNQPITPNRSLFTKSIFSDFPIPIVFHVQHISNHFLIFQGTKLTMVPLHITSSKTLSVPAVFDILLQSERYPYLIDRNLQIFANNQLYLNTQ
jgi:hypothetical protein